MNDDALFHRAMRELPPEVKDELMSQAIRDGLMPRPSGYDPEGNPVWRLEDVGAFLGLDETEQHEMIGKFELEYGPIKRLNPATIQRVN